MSIPKASIVPPSSPSRPNAASSPIPATAGGSTSGSSTSVTTASRRRDARVAIQYAAGVPKRRMRSIEIAFVLRRDDERVLGRRRVPSAATRSPGGTRAKIATTGSSEEGQGDARREDERRPEEPAAYGSMTSGSAGSPRSEGGLALRPDNSVRSTPARRPCSSNATTTAISYRTRGCAQAGMRTTVTWSLTGRASVT